MKTQDITLKKTKTLTHHQDASMELEFTNIKVLNSNQTSNNLIHLTTKTKFSFKLKKTLPWIMRVITAQTSRV